MAEKQKNTAVELAGKKSITATMASKYDMEPEAFHKTLKSTIIPGGKASNEQLAAFLVVANQYELNPFIKEIYAFPGRGGGITPIVSIDGWLNIINSHPQFDGMDIQDEFTDGGIFSTTVSIHRKDRKHPTVITEYYSECYRDTDNWKTKPVRMMHHKATIQCARYTFGFAGIYDPDEGERIQEAEMVDISDTVEVKTNGVATDLKKKLAAASQNGVKSAKNVKDEADTPPEPKNNQESDPVDIFDEVEADPQLQLD